MSIEIKSGNISLTCTTKEDVTTVLAALGAKAAFPPDEPKAKRTYVKKQRYNHAGQQTFGYKIAKTGVWNLGEGQIIFDSIRDGKSAIQTGRDTRLNARHSEKAVQLMYYTIRNKQYKKMSDEFARHIKELYSLKTNLLGSVEVSEGMTLA